LLLESKTGHSEGKHEQVPLMAHWFCVYIVCSETHIYTLQRIYNPWKCVCV